ncbi:MAG: YggS family pyridoxal phosphate-dependent enzyme [Planctomycetota bacterium]|nr:YggS family pyridoxal phosphate-dependent enzyme [Planctomycetota bacterium]
MTTQYADTLQQRYSDVCNRVAVAARKAGRKPDQIYLVAVTKHADAEQVKELYELGHRDFGENHVQQLVQRSAILDEYMNRLRLVPTIRRDPTSQSVSLFAPAPADARAVAGDTRDVRWHMIGHLQRNKAKRAAEISRLIHSVDSLRLAEELQLYALKKDVVIEVLVQVNCSGEASKFGCPMPAAIPLCEQIESMMNIRVRGLMTMAPYSDHPEDARPAFARCRELFEEMRREGYGEGRFNLLSMGMSGDFEVGIAEGANIVRVGTAIFGDARVGIHDDEPQERPEAPETDEADDARDAADDTASDSDADAERDSSEGRVRD